MQRACSETGMMAWDGRGGRGGAAVTQGGSAGRDREEGGCGCGAARRERGKRWLRCCKAGAHAVHFIIPNGPLWGDLAHLPHTALPHTLFPQ